MSIDSEMYGYYGHTEPLKGVYYGPGCLKDALPKLLKMLEVKKALVVTGKSLYTMVNSHVVDQSFNPDLLIDHHRQHRPTLSTK